MVYGGTIMKNLAAKKFYTSCKTFFQTVVTFEIKQN